MIKYIFFDLGNTLVDMSISRKALYFGLKSVFSDKLATEELVLKWEKESFKTFEYHYKKGEFFTIKRLQVMSLENVLLDYSIDLAEQKLIDIINEFWRYFIKNCKLYEDVVPTLYQLVKDGYRLGLITNGDEENVISILKQHNLNNMFKIKVISSVLKNYKPDPLLFEQTLELAKCLPQEAIYVGDSETDIHGAKLSRMITVILTRNNDRYEPIIISPDFWINSLSELPKLVPEISKT